MCALCSFIRRNPDRLALPDEVKRLTPPFVHAHPPLTNPTHYSRARHITTHSAFKKADQLLPGLGYCDSYKLSRHNSAPAQSRLGKKVTVAGNTSIKATSAA